jgi:hypothetical protein
MLAFSKEACWMALCSPLLIRLVEELIVQGEANVKGRAPAFVSVGKILLANHDNSGQKDVSLH